VNQIQILAALSNVVQTSTDADAVTPLFPPRYSTPCPPLVSLLRRSLIDQQLSESVAGP
jgi:hypothetical protein